METKLLLQMLTDSLPPGEGQRHNITLDKENQSLVVSLMLGDRYQHLRLQDLDLNRPTDELVDEICALIKKTAADAPKLADYHYHRFHFERSQLHDIARRAMFMAGTQEINSFWRLAYHSLASAADHLDAMIARACEDGEKEADDSPPKTP